MIEECNFKYKSVANEDLCSKIEYTHASPRPPPCCPGEENCILFQTYKLLNLFAAYETPAVQPTSPIVPYKEKK